MNEGRTQKILKAMEENSIPQMIISDPVAIFYLTGKWIHPGERMLALYLNVKGNHKLVINRLFPQERDLGVELVWYDDIEDAVELLSRYVDRDAVMGVDKNWPARFLLRLQELGGGSSFVNASWIVDQVRMIKDEEEQELMRVSSRINDGVMEKVIPLVAKGMTEMELDHRVREIYKEAGCEGVSFDPITAYGKNGADPHHATDDTKGKRGDCVVIDIGPAEEYVEANPGLKIVEGAYTIEDYCVGVDEGNTALLEAVNKALNEMIDDGTVDEIMNQYIGG